MNTLPTTLSIGAAMFAVLSSASVHAESIQWSQAVTIDREQNRVFVAGSEGQLRAFALDDGDSLWDSEQRGRPLALVGERLVAMSVPTAVGSMRVALIDAQTGSLEQFLDVTLDPEVRAEVKPEPAQSFHLDARVVAADRVRVHWRYEATPLRGALLDAENPERTERAGAFDLTLGNKPRIQTLATVTAPPAFVALLDAEQRVAGIAGAQFRGLDDANVMTSREEPDPVFGVRYQWRLFDRKGESLGGIESVYAYAPFFVHDGIAYVLAPPQASRDASGRVEILGDRLLAMDPRDGRELWQVPIMSSSYQGLMPP